MPSRKILIISVVATAVIAIAIIAILDHAANSTAEALGNAGPQIGTAIAENYGRDLAPLVVVEDGRLIKDHGSDGQGPALLKTWFYAVQISSGSKIQGPLDGWGRPFCRVLTSKSFVLISQGMAPTRFPCNADSIPEQLLLDIPRNKLIKTSGGHLIFITDRR